jgi:AGZA family xanthine/uracil permease-like MFS transporter
MPPSLAPTFLKMDLAGAFQLGLLTMVLTLLLVMLLDTAGTLIGVARQAGLLDEGGRLPRLRQALLADSGGAMLGAALGTSTTTAYIESAAGVEEGGRTGLTALVVSALFLASLFLAPLAQTVRTPRRLRSSSSPASWPRASARSNGTSRPNTSRRSPSR